MAWSVTDIRKLGERWAFSPFPRRECREGVTHGRSESHELLPEFVLNMLNLKGL